MSNVENVDMLYLVSGICVLCKLEKTNDVGIVDMVNPFVFDMVNGGAYEYAPLAEGSGGSGMKTIPILSAHIMTRHKAQEGLAVQYLKQLGEPVIETPDSKIII